MKLNELKAELKEKEKRRDELEIETDIIITEDNKITKKEISKDGKLWIENYNELEKLKAEISTLKKGISACEEILNRETNMKCLMCGVSLQREILNKKIHIHLCKSCRMEILNQSQQIQKPFDGSCNLQESFKSDIRSQTDIGNSQDEPRNKTADTQTLIKEMSHYKSRCVDLMCENDELKQALSQRNQEILEIVENICNDYQMYADMDEDEFWGSSTISPQDAQKRADYCWKLFEELKKQLTTKEEGEE